MSRRSFVAVLAAAAISSLALPAIAPAAPAADSVWVVPASPATGQLHYGDNFTAGYASKATQPWAYAECRPVATTVLGTPNLGTYTYGDVMWSEYRSLWAGGPSYGPFQLTDSIQHLWLGGGATCQLSVVKFTNGLKNRTVLATTAFQVAA